MNLFDEPARSIVQAGAVVSLLFYAVVRILISRQDRKKIASLEARVFELESARRHAIDEKVRQYNPTGTNPYGGMP